MEFLKKKEFTAAEEVVKFVNKKRVKVVSITRDTFYYTLFYKKRLD